MAAIVSVSTAYAATEQEIKEYQIKAAILFQLTKYVEWPPSARTAFNICFVEDDGFHAMKNWLTSRKVNNQQISIYFLSAKQSELGICDLIYLGNSRKTAAFNYIEQTESKPILVVSAMEDFVDRGGMVGLVNADGAIGVELNLHAFQDSKLKVSPALIEVARKVMQ